MQSHYAYHLTQDELRLSSHAKIRELADANFLAEDHNDYNKGLQTLQTDANRENFRLNGNEYKSLDREAFKKKLEESFTKPAADLLFQHYSQVPGMYASEFLFLYELANYTGLDLDASIFPEEKEVAQQQSTDIYVDPSDNQIYYKTVGVVPLSLILLADRQSKETRTAEYLFKLTQKGFELVRISTNQPLFKHLLMGDQDEVKKLAKPSSKPIEYKPYVRSERNDVQPERDAEKPLTWWQRRKNSVFAQKWKSLPGWKKILTGVIVGLSVCAIIATAIFFPPSILVTVPVIGQMTAAAVTMAATGIFAGGVLIVHGIDIATQKLPTKTIPEAPSSTKRESSSTPASTPTPSESSQVGIGRRLSRANSSNSATPPDTSPKAIVSDLPSPGGSKIDEPPSRPVVVKDQTTTAVKVTKQRSRL